MNPNPVLYQNYLNKKVTTVNNEYENYSINQNPKTKKGKNQLKPENEIICSEDFSIELPNKWTLVKIKDNQKIEKTFFLNKEEKLLTSLPVFSISDFKLFMKSNNFALDPNQMEKLHEKINLECCSYESEVKECIKCKANLNDKLNDFDYLRKKRVCLAPSDEEILQKRAGEYKLREDIALVENKNNFQKADVSDKIKPVSQKVINQINNFNNYNYYTGFDDIDEGELILATSSNAESLNGFCLLNKLAEKKNIQIKYHCTSTNDTIDSSILNKCVVTCSEFPWVVGTGIKKKKKDAQNAACASFLLLLFPGKNLKEIEKAICN